MQITIVLLYVNNDAHEGCDFNLAYVSTDVKNQQVFESYITFFIY